MLFCEDVATENALAATLRHEAQLITPRNSEGNWLRRLVLREAMASATPGQMRVATRRPVEKGDTVADFRGETATVIGWREPHKVGSTGRIIVSVEGWEQEFYPSVFDCEFVSS